MFHAGMFNGAVLAFQDITTLMRALRVKDDFVASVSHELRTPLTSIMGYVDMVLDQEELTERMERSLNVVMRNAERLLLLVSDLLMTAQAESGTLSMKTVATDLSRVVRQCIDSAIPRAEAAGVRLEARLGKLPQMQADPDRLDQVVSNLLSNAIKYTPKGGRVTVSLEQVGESALITVRDTGIGISSADQKSLFVRFFRASAVEKRAMPGVGLGLVITKAIVEAHGGGIEVTSEEGRGTTVYVGLPLTREGDRQISADSVASAAGANR
jgi:signal transduction histidine kinase